MDSAPAPRAAMSRAMPPLGGPPAGAPPRRGAKPGTCHDATLGVTLRPLVLCYHAVSDGWSHQLSVQRSAFARQLRALLRRRFRGATAQAVVAGRGRLLHVTFDDAYKSVASALPILEDAGVPATVFVSTGFAEDGAPLAVPELEAEAVKHPDHMSTLNWSELRSLAERGVEVGSHTVSHAHLTRMSDADLKRELRTSRSRCEDELARPCRFLAYPYGEHDARVQAAAREAGYEAAFALRRGAAHGNPFAIPRVDVYRKDSLFRAMAKTSAAGDAASALRSRFVSHR
jgi:peptidoglycan/xylan/chitin deacetylase (PgdA/CDA1 family)